MDPYNFRQALGAFATGVCLVTVNDPELGSLATTVNSFSSLSLDPPLVLWAIQNTSDHLRIYIESPHFGVSVLTAEQIAMARHYSQRGKHQVQSENFVMGAVGEPKLLGGLAHFSCELHTVHRGGDHQIIVGKVLDFCVAYGEPLIFFEGGYRKIS